MDANIEHTDSTGLYTMDETVLEDQILSEDDFNNECIDIANGLCKTYNKSKHNRRCIPLTNYHNLLALGCYHKIKQVLGLLPSQYVKQYVLNSVINYGDMRGLDFAFGLPLALAAYSGNERLFQLLLCQGTDLLIVEDNGNNILHCLVILSKTVPQVATQMYLMLMADLKADIKNKLLSTQNKDGQMPLDLGTVTCAFDMMAQIIHTSDVYYFPQEQLGVYTRVLYKLPMENCTPNTNNSILRSISNVGGHELDALESVNLLSMEPIKSLMSKRKRKYTGNMIKMLLWHCAIAVVFLVHILSFLDGNPMSAMVYTGLALICANIICEILSLKAQWRNIALFFNQWKALNTPVIVIFPTRVFFQGFLLFFAISCVQHLLEVPTETQIAIVSQTVFCLVLSLLFYLQCFKRTAALLLICINMLKDTVIFLILGAVVFLAYVSCFWILHFPLTKIDGDPSNTTYSKTENTTDTGSFTNFTTNVTNYSMQAGTGTHAESFVNFIASCYEMFLLSLAIMPPIDLYFTNSHDPNQATSLYVGCLFIWSVLLLNLLIAVFNDRLAQANRHENTISKLHQLGMMLYVESYIDANRFLFHPLESLKLCKNSKYSDVYTVDVLETLHRGKGPIQ